jgi:hypothetical protein
MDKQLIDAQVAGEILDELSDAVREGDAAIAAETGEAPAHRDAADDTQRQAQITRLQMIARARRQRDRGIKELHRSYTGVMAVRREATLNDPVLASTLQRYFGVIDKAYLIVGRRGPDIIGVAATEQFLRSIDDRVTEFAQDIQREAAAAQAMQIADAGAEDFVRPEYTKSAAQETVFAKHRKTLELLDAIIAGDRLVEDLNVMAWNGKVDMDKVEDVRLRIKKQVAKIFTFSDSTMRGMLRRVAPADAVPQQKAPAPAAEVAPAAEQPFDRNPDEIQIEVQDGMTAA